MLVNSQGHVKLCDFGVSVQLLTSLTKTFIGTNAYMAVSVLQKLLNAKKKKAKFLLIGCELQICMKITFVISSEVCTQAYSHAIFACSLLSLKES